MAKYSPPPGFTPLPADTRSDDEIASLLQSYQPVTTEKNVWAFWHSGWAGMRPWCQRNIINWARRLGADWTVRVLDNVDGSANNMLRFVESRHFPRAINDGSMGGPPQHLSDLLRLPLIFLHGGVWMDAGMILLRHLDDICWTAIESRDSPYEMAGILMALRPELGPMLNGFIAARKGNVMLQHWHAVYCALWDGKTSADGFHSHPLLAHLAPYKVQIGQLGCPPLLMPDEALGDYLAHFLSFERLAHLHDTKEGFDGADYFEKKILKLTAWDTLYYAQKITGWDGRKQYEMLATKVGDTDAPMHAEAAGFVDDVLRHSSMVKLSHGPPCGLENLASIWDGEGHAEDDIAPGTFAEYLRHASVSWDLKQTIEPVVLERPREVYTAGVLEAITRLD